jgi:hypothetical protein
MDIIKKVKPAKASYETLSLKNKLLLVVTLVSFASIVIPHQTQAQTVKQGDAMVFEIGDYEDYLNGIEQQGLKKFSNEQIVAMLKKQIRLGEALRQYLITQNSPLADHANTLVQQNNWKKIIALSNAESSMCRKYIEATSNCWGVGGSNLWTMGENLDQAIVSMNRFLNNYPLRSSKKYTAMTFDEMNGLYKQPAREHWVVNNEVVYDDLTAIEASINAVALK